jgi:polyphosphate kinase 2 (PPK2 family)
MTVRSARSGTNHGQEAQAEAAGRQWPGQASITLTRKEFEKELYQLQVELTRLQAWTVAKGARVIVVFEGRDTAGKGGVIKRITERCSPRVFRHVALPAPSDREKSQLYIQRYMAHFPAAGEIILFDRSWYNRAGVERVMGFCTDDQYERFLKLGFATPPRADAAVGPVTPADSPAGVRAASRTDPAAPVRARIAGPTPGGRCRGGGGCSPGSG